MSERVPNVKDHRIIRGGEVSYTSSHSFQMGDMRSIKNDKIEGPENPPRSQDLYRLGDNFQ